MPYVPIVDMSADPAAVGAELDEICRTVGFFQITGHGIPDGVAEPAWTTATRFFDLPMQDKLSVARPTPDYPPGFFAAKTGHAANALRAINYPARDTASLPGQLRAGAHTDYGTLTILRQDAVGGLEVLGPAGTWAAVEPVPGAFVVNIGDLMARWTNDRWRSTLHRVVDPPDPRAAAARRQSMPYFQNANWSAEISCLQTCLEPGGKPRHAPVLAGPYLMGKFRRSVTF